jgi:pimeloyl-ACP methyl ester carboxylesterase
MKSKIIIILILFILFTPAVSRANMIIPQANLTLVVNTQGSDSSFNFDLADCPTVVCDDPTQINLQTQNLSASNSVSLTAFGDKYILAEENTVGLKINSIFCTSDNPTDVFWYQTDSVEFSPIADENITCMFDNVKAKTPILIVPGLLGTEIKKGNETLWINSEMVNPFNDDSFMNLLQFSSDLNPLNNQVASTDIIKSIKVNIGGIDFTVYNYVGDLIQEFQNQGYVENENLFTFPYDWRYGVSGKFADGTTNVDLLAQKIQDILQQTGSDKVDVIAHSLGGLIVKEYVINHPADNHIRKAVFVGVPNTGAPKAVKVLLQGDNFGVLGLNDQEMKKIAENMPAAYDLLPDEQYYNTKGSFISLVDFTSGEPTEKDLNYQEFENYLTQDHNLNSQALTGSESLHSQDFDNFDLRTAGVDLYAIDGCKAATMTNFLEVKYQDILGNYHTDYDRVELKTGDGTVPLESSTNLPIDQNNKYYALVSDHGKMPSEDGIRQEIVNLLSDSNLDTGNNLITQDINQCQLNGKAISVFSPVNIFVTDQNGNRLGLADDGSIINEIPNADFEIWGEHKFVYLPTDNGQIYSINLTGTDTGTFTIKSQDINNSQITGTEVFSNLPVTLELIGSVLISPADGSASLEIKQNPTSDEQTILPDSTLIDAKADDYLPPNSIATLTGEKDEQGNYKGEVVVGIKSADDNSEVLNIQYNLNNAGFQKVSGDTADFKISTEGKHTLIFFATDNAGNNEQEKEIDFEIVPVSQIPTVATGSGGNSYMLIQKNQNQNLLPNQIALVETASPQTQIIPPAEENPKPISKKIVRQPSQPQKNITQITDAGLVQNNQAKNEASKTQTINPFLASMGSFGSWFFNLLHKIFRFLK